MASALDGALNLFDLIVIGGGSGGSACARRAASYGAKVAIVERGESRDANGIRRGAGIGGTCVNVGCVPKKLMFNAAQHREALLGSAATAQGYGLALPAKDTPVPAFDWAGVKARRDAYVDKLHTSYADNWARAGVEVVLGVASFVGGGGGDDGGGGEDGGGEGEGGGAKLHRVQVVLNEQGGGGGVRTLAAPKVVVAVGGRPALPDIQGKELAITSDGFFDLAALPSSVAVVGAGYIAVELACILHGLGAKHVGLFFRGNTVLRHGFDPFIVETLMAELDAHGPRLHPQCSPQAITRHTAADGTSSLTLTTTTAAATTTAEKQAEEHVEEHGGLDCVIMAVGRAPATEKALGLEGAGVQCDRRGRIEVDAYENTSVEGIYAIGDATTTGYELTPVAIAAGRRLGDRLFGGAPHARIDYACIATVVFSHPPIGTIGLTEPQAVAEYGRAAVTAKESRFPSMLYAFNAPEAKVMTGLKLVLAGPDERVVGLHLIGPHSDEMLQGFAVAVRMGATRRDLEATVAVHPTVAEELVTFAGWGQATDPDTGRSTPALPTAFLTPAPPPPVLPPPVLLPQPLLQGE